MEETLILVDEQDRCIGHQTKLSVHQQGLLHRAFSIFIFDERGNLLIQQRADGKYHSAGLWANSCCGHPRKDEEVAEAASRRLFEELNITCPLHKVSTTIYRVDVPDNLIEHEYDHIFVGIYTRAFSPNPEEIKAYRWISISDLFENIQQSPEKYCAWFLHIMGTMTKHQFLEWYQHALLAK